MSFDEKVLAQLKTINDDVAACRKFLDRIELYDITLNTTNLMSALYEAGMCIPVFVASEFVLAPGATSQVFLIAPPGFVLVNISEAEYYTNLPFKTTYLLYMDNLPPGIPVFACIRMPTNVTAPAFIAFLKNFMLHQVTNLDPINTANAMLKNVLILITTEVYDMLKRVYFDPVVKDLKERSKPLSGTPR